jgi:hypothetical protein
MGERICLHVSASGVLSGHATGNAAQETTEMNFTPAQLMTVRIALSGFVKTCKAAMEAAKAHGDQENLDYWSGELADAESALETARGA